MANTMLLNPDTWDFVLDASGNMALAKEPYAVAQDVASACKLFKGELWYNTAPGIPYFQQVLGHFPPLSLMKSYFKEAALTVPTVAQVNVVFTKFEDRVLGGQVQFITDSGQEAGITL